MSCSNCFNGCAEIVSDQCVKYTGPSIPSLGITTGDPLSTVEQSITNTIVTILTGSNIVPDIDPDIVCDLVKGNLPLTDIDLVDYLTALIKSVCSLQDQLDGVSDAVATIEAPYTIGCLTGVTSVSGTHDILQAVITKLCSVNSSLGALALNLSTNYSSNGAQLDAYIANYLSIHFPSSTLMSAKMVPYAAYPFFGDTTGKFDSDGVGIVGTDWEKVYLCNGHLGLTPDMRGRVPVGAIVGMAGGALNSYVDPGASAFNPNYAVGGTLYGANSVTLSSTQVPNHSHTATATASQESHFHYTFNADVPTGADAPAVTATNYPTYRLETADTLSYRIKGTYTVATLGKTNAVTPTITVNSVTVNPTAGGGGAHANIQPVIACYYIMYIP